MYVEQLSLWNFRKYGSNENLNRPPNLKIQFKEGVNLLIGENDSGKTAILDAIKIITFTRSNEYLRLQFEDFYHDRNADHPLTKLKIECIFAGFKDIEAKNFLEWLSIRNVGGHDEFYLRVFLEADLKGAIVLPYEIKSGADDEGSVLSAGARDLIRATYLKALRDAETELSPKRNSRLSQILDSHDAFKNKIDHPLMTAMSTANTLIKDYFRGIDEQGAEIEGHPGLNLTNSINALLHDFFGSKKESSFEISTQSLKNILEKLELILERGNNGLGSHNLLFIAAELLLLTRKDFTGLRLALIEEIESHLHPQAQMRLIEYLVNDAKENRVQLILTSHSPNLASKVYLANIIICKNNSAFSLAPEYTELRKGDYAFLQRFLDTTKANFFFAQSVLFVEGDAENLLIPALARIIGRDLTKYGVSVVNLGNTAFNRYVRIFKRKDPNNLMGIKVACLTDCDVKLGSGLTVAEIEQKRLDKAALYDGQDVKTFVSAFKTLEYDLALGGLRQALYLAALLAGKLKNSDAYGVTYSKYKTVLAMHKERYDDWSFQEQGVEEIAFKIYSIINDNDLKSITAQFLASILEHKSKTEPIRQIILNDKYFRYIVEAIEYVTEPLNQPPNVAANN